MLQFILTWLIIGCIMNIANLLAEWWLDVEGYEEMSPKSILVLSSIAITLLGPLHIIITIIIAITKTKEKSNNE